MAHEFEIGEEVEIAGNYEFYRAKVIWRTKSKVKLQVQNLTLGIMEEVEKRNLRPLQPFDGCLPFKVNTLVDVDMGHLRWCTGVVTKLLPKRKYSVRLKSTGEVREYRRAQLRNHRQWIDGRWSKSPLEELTGKEKQKTKRKYKEEDEEEEKENRRKKRKEEEEEEEEEEEGRIEEEKRKRKEEEDRRIEEEKRKSKKEERMKRKEKEKEKEEEEERRKEIEKEKGKERKIKDEMYDLSEGANVEVGNKKKEKGIEKTIFSLIEGTRVEVSNNEPGFEGSWYAARIVDAVGNDKFRVKYVTLRNDDNTAPLIETFDGHQIRPVPPEICLLDGYSPDEVVDAYVNEGWWEGRILKSLSDSKYKVEFETTDERLAYHFNQLRPHQNWVGGKWFMAPPKPRKSKDEQKL